MSGKGSKRRPLSVGVPSDAYAQGWDRIFGGHSKCDHEDSNNEHIEVYDFGRMARCDLCGKEWRVYDGASRS